MKNIITLVFILALFSYDALTKKHTSFIPNSFSATYEKSYKAFVGKKIITAPGSLDYKYPSHIYLKYKEGKITKEVIINKKKVWDFTPAFIKTEKNELREYKYQKNALLKFLDVMHEGLRDNKMFTVKKKKDLIVVNFSKSMQQAYNFVSAELYPKSKVADVKTIKDVTKIVLNYMKKKPETYTFKKITDKKFETSHFIFATPENTNVTKN